jgi:hypothetical protein
MSDFFNTIRSLKKTTFTIVRLEAQQDLNVRYLGTVHHLCLDMIS